MTHGFLRQWWYILEKSNEQVNLSDQPSPHQQVKLYCQNRAMTMKMGEKETQKKKWLSKKIKSFIQGNLWKFEYGMSLWKQQRITNLPIINGLPSINNIYRGLMLICSWSGKDFWMTYSYMWSHTREKKICQLTAYFLCRNWGIWLKGEIIQLCDDWGKGVLPNLCSLKMWNYWIF